jgi:membrane protein YdbS with pleckstrin-like domain
VLKNKVKFLAVSGITRRAFMSNTTKFVGKLSLWGAIAALLLWLGKQLIGYLLLLLTPWLNWLFGWAVLIAAGVVFIALGMMLIVGYLAFRSFTKRREKPAPEGEKAAS